MIGFAVVAVIPFALTAASLGREASAGYWAAVAGLAAGAFLLAVWAGMLRYEGRSRSRGTIVGIVGAAGYATFVLVDTSGDQIKTAVAAGLVGFFLGLAVAMHLNKRKSGTRVGAR